MITTDIEYKSSTLSYIPQVYGKIKEFKALSEAYNRENEMLATKIKETFDNFFILSLNEYGCERWEKILNIKVNSGNTLEDRRFAILTRLLGMRPYTRKKIKQILDALIGENNYTFDLDFRQKTLKMKMGLAVKNQRRSVDELLDSIIPANITIDTMLMYNTHEMLNRYTNEQLNKATHLQLREEELTNVI